MTAIGQIWEIGACLTGSGSGTGINSNHYNQEMRAEIFYVLEKAFVEFEQNGSERAEYGSNLLNRLSADLSYQYGKGFSRSNILYMRKFYICFPNSETVSHVLSWSHYFEILKSDDGRL